MEYYFMNYASLQQQRWMVGDSPRTNAFARAIAEVVRPGDVVIDVGAGTGILSMLAAKAGARRVIAIEASDMADVARKLIEANGLQDIVEVFHGYAEDLQLDEEADVIVSEWLGHMAYVEDMFPSVLAVRDRFLKADGVMLPSRVDLLLAPLDDGELFHDMGPGYWNRGLIEGIDFSSLMEMELKSGHSTKMEVPSHYMLGPGAVFHSLDTRACMMHEWWTTGECEIVTARRGELNGFVGWFRAQLSKSVVLDTSPQAPCTHWEQTYFPFGPFQVKRGERIPVKLRMEDPYEGSRLMELTIEAKGQKIRFLVT